MRGLQGGVEDWSSRTTAGVSGMRGWGGGWREREVREFERLVVTHMLESGHAQLLWHNIYKSPCLFILTRLSCDSPGGCNIVLSLKIPLISTGARTGNLRAEGVISRAARSLWHMLTQNLLIKWVMYYRFIMKLSNMMHYQALLKRRRWTISTARAENYRWMWCLVLTKIILF